jgi:hypothetical protein
VKKSSTIPDKIIKLQKKLCSFELGSRNYKKYQKILAKHIKKHNMKQRVTSDIKTIEIIKELEK